MRLGLTFRNIGRERLMRDGNVLRDIRDHFNALLDVPRAKDRRPIGNTEMRPARKNERHRQ